jgi:hypothetical protein
MPWLISIQPLSRFRQEPEPGQATSTALARCILGKFLGLICHCFPLVPYKGLKYEEFLKKPSKCDFQEESASWDLWNSCNTLSQFWQLNDVT